MIQNITKTNLNHLILASLLNLPLKVSKSILLYKHEYLHIEVTARNPFKMTIQFYNSKNQWDEPELKISCSSPCSLIDTPSIFHSFDEIIQNPIFVTLSSKDKKLLWDDEKVQSIIANNTNEWMMQVFRTKGIIGTNMYLNSIKLNIVLDTADIVSEEMDRLLDLTDEEFILFIKHAIHHRLKNNHYDTKLPSVPSMFNILHMLMDNYDNQRGN